jgi:hypothetical protein
MANWIKANGTGPSIFWNFGDGSLPLDIPNYTSGGTLDATAAFKAAFGTGNALCDPVTRRTAETGHLARAGLRSASANDRPRARSSRSRRR